MAITPKEMKTWLSTVPTGIFPNEENFLYWLDDTGDIRALPWRTAKDWIWNGTSGIMDGLATNENFHSFEELYLLASDAFNSLVDGGREIDEQNA